MIKVNIKAVFIVDIKTNFNPETPDISGQSTKNFIYKTLVKYI